MIVWSWPPLRRHGALLREPGAAAEPPADYGRPGGRRRPVPGSGAGDGGPGLLRAACTFQSGRGRRSPRPLPVPEDRLARVRPPARVAVSPEDIEWLAGEVPASYRALRLVGGVLGLRWGEVVGLRMADVDFLRRTITVRQVVEEMAGQMDIAAEAKSAARPRTLSTPLSASGFFIDEVADHVARFRTDGRSDPLSLAGGSRELLQRVRSPCTPAWWTSGPSWATAARQYADLRFDAGALPLAIPTPEHRVRRTEHDRRARDQRICVRVMAS